MFVEVAKLAYSFRFQVSSHSCQVRLVGIAIRAVRHSRGLVVDVVPHGLVVEAGGEGSTDSEDEPGVEGFLQ